MVRFAESDDELGVAIAYALSAEMLREEREELDDDDTAALDRFDTDVTLLGLRFAAGAGFDPASAAPLWERLAVEHPEDIIERRDADTPMERTRYPLPLRILVSRDFASAVAPPGAAGDPPEAPSDGR